MDAAGHIEEDFIIHWAYFTVSIANFMDFQYVLERGKIKTDEGAAAAVLEGVRRDLGWRIVDL